jgi:hypothetical protein
VARKKATDNTYVLFDVEYEDGTRTSNRKVRSPKLLGLEGDEPALGIIEAEDRKIEAMSGKPRGPIRSIARAAGQ